MSWSIASGPPKAENHIYIFFCWGIWRILRSMLGGFWKMFGGVFSRFYIIICSYTVVYILTFSYCFPIFSSGDCSCSPCLLFMILVTSRHLGIHLWQHQSRTSPASLLENGESISTLRSADNVYLLDTKNRDRYISRNKNWKIELFRSNLDVGLNVLLELTARQRCPDQTRQRCRDQVQRWTGMSWSSLQELRCLDWP